MFNRQMPSISVMTYTWLGRPQIQTLIFEWRISGESFGLKTQTYFLRRVRLKNRDHALSIYTPKMAGAGAKEKQCQKVNQDG